MPKLSPIIFDPFPILPRRAWFNINKILPPRSTYSPAFEDRPPVRPAIRRVNGALICTRAPTINAGQEFGWLGVGLHHHTPVQSATHNHHHQHQRYSTLPLLPRLVFFLIDRA